MSINTSITDEYNRLSPLHRAAHDLIHTALPIMFTLLFVIAGTIVLIYTLYLERIIPKSLIIGISIAFAILIISICIGRVVLYLAWNTYAEGFGLSNASDEVTSDKGTTRFGRRPVDTSREGKRDRKRILRALMNHLRYYGENYYTRLALPIRRYPTAQARYSASTTYGSDQPQLSNEQRQSQYANTVGAIIKQEKENAISREVRALSPNPSATVPIRTTPKLPEVHTSMIGTKDKVSAWRNSLQESCGLSSHSPKRPISQNSEKTASPLACQPMKLPSPLIADKHLARGDTKTRAFRTNQQRHLYIDNFGLREEEEPFSSADHIVNSRAQKLKSHITGKAVLERLSIIVPDPLSSAEDAPQMKKRHLMYLRMPDTTQEEAEYMRHQIICLGQRVAQLLPPEHWN